MDKPKPKFRPLNILTKPPVKKGEKPVTAMAANGLKDISTSDKISKGSTLASGVLSMIGQSGALMGDENLANVGIIGSNIASLGGDIAGEFAKRGTKESIPKLRKGAKGMRC